jgi:hypothetical protein
VTEGKSEVLQVLVRQLREDIEINIVFNQNRCIVAEFEVL